MAYGVDQCRVCGRRMKIVDPDAAARYEARIGKKPTMSPKQWEKQGWKAAPTPYEKWRDLAGVCFDCKPIVMSRRKNQQTLRMAGAVGGFALLALMVMFYLASSMR